MVLRIQTTSKSDHLKIDGTGPIEYKVWADFLQLLTPLFTDMTKRDKDVSDEFLVILREHNWPMHPLTAPHNSLAYEIYCNRHRLPQNIKEWRQHPLLQAYWFSRGVNAVALKQMADQHVIAAERGESVYASMAAMTEEYQKAYPGWCAPILKSSISKYNYVPHGSFQDKCIQELAVPAGSEFAAMLARARLPTREQKREQIVRDIYEKAKQERKEYEALYGAGNPRLEIALRAVKNNARRAENRKRFKWHQVDSQRAERERAAQVAAPVAAAQVAAPVAAQQGPSKGPSKLWDEMVDRENALEAVLHAPHFGQKAHNPFILA